MRIQGGLIGVVRRCSKGHEQQFLTLTKRFVVWLRFAGAMDTATLHRLAVDRM
jgi:hypothetical protein